MPLRFGKRTAGWYRQRFLTALAGLCGIVFTVPASACPGILLAKHLPFQNASALSRHQLGLFAFDAGSWKNIDLQVDPLDAEGSLQFPKNPIWFREALEENDRLSFRVEAFAGKYTGKGGLPCSAREIVEISYRGTFAYLMACKNPPEQKRVEPVEFRERERLVESKQYRYRYGEKNHLVFETIQLSDRLGKDFIPAARDADLLIVGDVKNFFTLTFDSDDIEAQIKHKRNGSLGFMAGLEFYLNIMAFRINMELLPEANFFEDALFMPMSMTLPVNAAKYLRRGSGIYYSWASEKEAEWDWSQSQIDDLDLKRLDPNGKTPFTAPNPKHCDARYCNYRLTGKTKGRHFVMNFVIGRAAADLGFFPQLIRDVGAVEKTLARKISRFPPEKRVAIYFETARLPQGTHTWDFWIYFPDSDKSGECRFNLNRKNVNEWIGKS